jgi:hypothetical protein
LVRAPGIGDAGETLNAVADDGAVQVEAAPGEPGDRGGTELVIWRSFSQTGFPAAVVPTVAVNGVLPARCKWLDAHSGRVTAGVTL